MKKNLIIGAVTAGLILGGALMVGASQNDDKSATNATEQDLDTVVMDTSKKNVTMNESTTNNNGETETKKTQPEKQVENSKKDDGKQEPAINKEEAIQLAESQTGAKVIEIELDRDDHRLIYEIELVEERAEIEMEIDASTGKIIELDYDDDDDDYDERH